MLDNYLQDKSKFKNEIDAVEIKNFTTLCYFTKRQIAISQSSSPKCAEFGLIKKLDEQEWTRQTFSMCESKHRSNCFRLYINLASSAMQRTLD